MDFFDDQDDFEMLEADSPALPVGDGLKPAAQSDFSIGHEGVEAQLLSQWQAGTMPHALVFQGLQGIGKATFAYRLARFILKDSSSSGGESGGLFGEALPPESLAVAADDPVFTKVASGGHPDFLLIGRPFDEKKGQPKADIPVDDIRKVAPFLRKTSSDGGWRVVIIDDANMMNRNGQNALLKILEEPPQKALLILVCHGAGGLLPTIRSRCRFIGFDPLCDDHMREILKTSGDIKPGDLDLIMALSEGSAGQALALLDNDGLQTISRILTLLNDVQDMSMAQIDETALAYGKSGDDRQLDHFCFALHKYFDAMIDLAVTGQTAKSLGSLPLTRPATLSLQDILHLQDSVADHIDTCRRGNLDKHFMVYQALILLQRPNG